MAESIDKEHDIPIYSPICSYCTHFYMGKFLSSGKRSCKAFENIPIEIWEGKNPHTKVYSGDGGVMFERRRKG